MTNREWLNNLSNEKLAERLQYGACKFCVSEHLNCHDADCEERIQIWLNEEHKEPIKLSDAERTILENLDKEWNWIGRNKNGFLQVFDGEPVKTTYSDWGRCDIAERYLLFNNLFQFIKWEDEEPYNIEELLKMNKEQLQAKLDKAREQLAELDRRKNRFRKPESRFFMWCMGIRLDERVKILEKLVEEEK